MEDRRKTRDESSRATGPRYLVAYSSIVTLLLAFFITMQAFANVRESGYFYQGQGSFIRALESFGLGGVWPLSGGSMLGGGAPAPRYLAAEGEDSPPEKEPIQPDAEAAKNALDQLRERFPHRNAPTTDSEVVFSTPLDCEPGRPALQEPEEEFLTEFAGSTGPALLSGGCVIGVAAFYLRSDEDTIRSASRALRAAVQVRERLLHHTPPEVRDTANRRIYAFCQPVALNEGERPPQEGRIDLVVTKTKVRHVKINERGTQ